MHDETSASATFEDDVPLQFRPTPSDSPGLVAKLGVVFAIVVVAGLALRPIVSRIMNYGQLPAVDEVVFDPEWFTSVAFASDGMPGRIERSPKGDIKAIFGPLGGSVDDAWMSHLESLADLQIVDFSHSIVSDAGLVSLQSLPRLGELRLDRSNVNGSGFFTVGKFKSLKVLSLKQCPVDDEGVKGIATLSGLQELDLSNSRVTDAGLLHLSKLTELGELNLSGTNVTDGGLQKLGRNIPSCRIVK